MPLRRDEQLPFCKALLPFPTKNPPGTDTRRTVLSILILQFLLQNNLADAAYILHEKVGIQRQSQHPFATCRATGVASTSSRLWMPKFFSSCIAQLIIPHCLPMAFSEASASLHPRGTRRYSVLTTRNPPDRPPDPAGSERSAS